METAAEPAAHGRLWWLLRPRAIRDRERRAYLEEIESRARLAAGEQPGEERLATLREHATAVAPTEVPLRLILAYLGPVLVAGTVAGIAAGIALPLLWLPGPGAVPDWLGALFVWVVLFSGVILVARVAFSIVLALGGRAVFLLALGGLGIAACVEVDRSGLPFGLGPAEAYAATAAAATAAAVALAWLAVSVVSLGLYSLFARSSLTGHPESLLVVSLVNALAAVRAIEAGGAKAQLHDRRWRALQELERAALAAERATAKRLAPGDPATAAWLRERADGVAAALRFHKRSLLEGGPGDGTLAERLEETLEHALAERWGDLERRRPTPIAARSRARGFVSTAIRASIPLGALLVLRGFGIADEGALADYLLVATGAWLVLTFLAQYDPLFSAKMGSVGDLTKTLGSPGPKP